MAIAIDISDGSGIPDQCRQAILQLMPEFSGDWRVSVISSHDNPDWTLKLENARGVIRRHKIQPEHQHPKGLQVCMRQLRDEIEADR